MTSNLLLQQCSEADYLVRVETALVATLREAAGTIAEPAAPAASDARRRIAMSVERVVGFALGVIAGSVVDSTRRWFGEDAARAVRDAVVCEGAEDRSRVEVAYLGDRDQRPLVDAYAAALHVRFTRIGRDVRVLLARLAEIVGAHDEANRHRMQVALHLLAVDDHIERRVGAEIVHAWAAVTATQSVAPVVARDPHQRAGYIMLVA